MALNLDDELAKYKAALEEIDAQLVPLNEERQKLAKVIKALEDAWPGPAAPKRKRARGSTGGGPKPRYTRAGNETREELLAAIKAEPGQSAAAYAKGIGMAAQTGRNHLAALEEAGEIRREGERSGTKYYPA